MRRRYRVDYDSVDRLDKLGVPIRLPQVPQDVWSAAVDVSGSRWTVPILPRGRQVLRISAAESRNTVLGPPRRPGPEAVSLPPRDYGESGDGRRNWSEFGPEALRTLTRTRRSGAERVRDARTPRMRGGGPPRSRRTGSLTCRFGETSTWPSASLPRGAKEAEHGLVFIHDRRAGPCRPMMSQKMQESHASVSCDLGLWQGPRPLQFVATGATIGTSKRIPARLDSPAASGLEPPTRA